MVLLGMSLLILMPLLFSNSACTLIGIAIGVAGSADAPPSRLHAEDVFRVSPGALIIVATKGQKEYSGVYLGRRLVEDTSYTSRYQRWSAATPGAPALGRPVEIERVDGSREVLTFDGFTYRAVRVVREPTLEAENVGFKRLRALKADTIKVWTGDELARLDVAGEIPSREAVRVGIVRPFSWRWRSSQMTDAWVETTDFPEQAVLPVDRVSAILVHGRSAAPLVLGLIGLGADILVVRSIHEQTSHEKCGDSGGPVPTISCVERSEHDFLPFAGEFALPALAAAPTDSSASARDR
jgi:hypothetical protein